MSAGAQPEDDGASAAAKPAPANGSPVGPTPAEAVSVTTVVDTAEDLPRDQEEHGPPPVAEVPYVEEADIVVTVAAPTKAGEPLHTGG